VPIVLVLFYLIINITQVVHDNQYKVIAAAANIIRTSSRNSLPCRYFAMFILPCSIKIDTTSLHYFLFVFQCNMVTPACISFIYFFMKGCHMYHPYIIFGSLFECAIHPCLSLLRFSIKIASAAPICALILSHFCIKVASPPIHHFDLLFILEMCPISRLCYFASLFNPKKLSPYHCIIFSSFSWNYCLALFYFDTLLN